MAHQRSWEGRSEIKAVDNCGNGESYLWADPPFSHVPQEKMNSLKLFFMEHIIKDHTELPHHCRAGHESTIIGILWVHILG